MYQLRQTQSLTVSVEEHNVQSFTMGQPWTMNIEHAYFPLAAGTHLASAESLCSCRSETALALEEYHLSACNPLSWISLLS